MNLLFGIAVAVLFAIGVPITLSGQITVYLAGDSTCSNKSDEKRPETGWGEMLQQHFDEKKVRVINEAQNGRSTKSFIVEGRWASIVDRLKENDWVFVQFGHNDESKDKGERYTPPEDFKNNLRRFVADVRKKKANVVLMTPVMRRRFDKDHKFYDTHGEYPEYTRLVAKELNVTLIDMHRKSERVIISYGDEGSRALFLQLKPGENANYPNGLEDNTHFNQKGAEIMAGLAVEGIRETKIRLARYLNK